ncbi:hypothetical protein AVEN_209808-1 [Araneus ventricosus]|uniref:HTH psq-type domain-containing protein n=1 Tax=Araneus ventricosus TaxID=182803 RepID=A0A4Y2JUH0_ARAVE|nr:hypothetical protein AVEN_109012-1 [Araneus ventricosus]GBM92950.1 hypothetical protein AVEN_116793-1 [Araneus ventricosus]GBM92999.1 hypothetical protein AVEN_185914-1 [Araneus ventricosus]GBM93012.1 hypothetical protein AVEN_209808-1 [Araneus ventricosus]
MTLKLENVKAKVLEQQRKNLILHEVDKGVKKKDIAVKFGIPPNSLSTIIVDSVKNKNNTAMNCDEDEDDEDGNDHEAEINKPSYDKVLKFINFNIKLFFN